MSINYMDKWVTPLGRVFKIRKKVVHDFVELSTLKRGLIKWVTPLGRVFKIHNIFLHDFDKKIMS